RMYQRIKTPGEWPQRGTKRHEKGKPASVLLFVSLRASLWPSSSFKSLAGELQERGVEVELAGPDARGPAVGDQLREALAAGLGVHVEHHPLAVVADHVHLPLRVLLLERQRRVERHQLAPADDPDPVADLLH